MTDVCYAGTSIMLQMVYTTQRVMNKCETFLMVLSITVHYVRYIMVTRYIYNSYFIHMQNNCYSKLLYSERMSVKPSYIKIQI